MRELGSTRCFRLTVLLLALAVSGCGGKRPPTMPQRLAKARAADAGPKRVKALIGVARAQMEADDPIGALDTIAEATDQAGSGETAAPSLLEIARAYLELGDPRDARRILGNVVEIGKSIDDPVRKAKIFADAGALYGNDETGLADSQHAKTLLGDARGLAEGEGVDERFKAETLAAVAMGYVGGGMTQEASQMLEKLEACLDALDDPRAKTEALAAAASVYAQTGDEEKAAGFLKDAASTTDGIDRAESKAYALLAVAKAEHAAGNTDTAVSLLQRAEKVAGKVSDPESQADALKTIRTTMARIKK